MKNPWSVQIELTEGCNRRCKMCGIHTIMKNNFYFKFMTLELAEQISKELNEWFDHKRIEFALQGEPLLNKNSAKIIEIFRTNFPKSQLLITTNGDPILNKTKKIDKLFESGLNTLLIDAYDTYENWNEYLINSELKINTYNYFRDKPKVWAYKGYKHKEIILIEDFENNNGKTAQKRFNNQAGNVYNEELGIFPLLEPIKQRCTNVFRELVIKYDGTVTACCMDWRRELIVGKFPEQTLKNIWQSDKFNAIRQLLYNKERIIVPCCFCNYKGFRVGLVDDPEINKSNEELKKYIEDN